MNRTPRPRTVIRLVNEAPFDKCLLATLNRFHFKSIYLDPGADSPYTFFYTGKILKDRSSQFESLHLDADQFSRIERRSTPRTASPLTRDYPAELKIFLETYVNSETQIANRLPRSDAWVPRMDALSDSFEGEMLASLGLKAECSPRPFGVAMTHDVDVVGKSLNANVKSGLVFAANALRCVRNGDAFKFYLKAAFRFLFGNVDYHGFDHILDIASRNDFKPVFFLFSRVGNANKLSLSERLYQRNPNYDLGSEYMRRVVRKILEFGASIGAHGSYHSAGDHRLLKEEKCRLEDFVQMPVQCVRQHFLNFLGKKTLESYSRLGLEFESNCGFITSNGLLCETTRPFFASLPGEESSRVIVVPMAFMDAVPLYFAPKAVQRVASDLEEMVRQTRAFGGMVAVNFHQRMISCFPEYRQMYEDLAITVRKYGGHLVTLQDVDDLFPER